MNSIQKLKEKIRSTNKKNGFEESDVRILNGENKISIDEFVNITPYFAKANPAHVFISFSDYPKQIIFTDCITERVTDKKSYEKHSGLIYEYVPITEEHAEIFLNLI